MNKYFAILIALMIVSTTICRAQIRVKSLRHGNNVISSVRFTSDGQVISSSDNGTVVSWNPETGKKNWSVDCDEVTKEVNKDDYTISEVSAMAISGHTIVAAYTQSRVIGGWLQKGEEFVIALLDVKTGQRVMTLKGSSSRVLQLASTMDGSTVASGGADGKVYLWDTSTGNKTQVIEFVRGISALSYSSNDELLIGQAGTNSIQLPNKKDIILWDTKINREIKSFSIESRYVNDAAFSIDGKQIAVIGQIPDAITLYDAETFQIVRSLKSPLISANRLVFSPDSKRVAFYDSSYQTNSGIVFLWDVEKNNKPNQIRISGSSVETAALSQSGKELAIGTDNGRILLYRLKE